MIRPAAAKFALVRYWDIDAHPWPTSAASAFAAVHGSYGVGFCGGLHLGLQRKAPYHSACASDAIWSPRLEL